MSSSSISVVFVDEIGSTLATQKLDSGHVVDEQAIALREPAPRCLTASNYRLCPQVADRVPDHPCFGIVLLRNLVGWFFDTQGFKTQGLVAKMLTGKTSTQQT